MTVRELTDLLIYAGTVAGALAAIGIFLRFAVVRPLKSWIHEQIAPQTQKIEKIHDEVTPNSGHSIKDNVTSMSTEISALRAALDAHMVEEVPRAWRTLDSIRARLDEHLRNHPGETRT